MKTFQTGSLESPRLKKLIDFLRDCGTAGATTFTITLACNTTRASSDVAELRALGVPIAVAYEGKSEAGRKIYRYRLTENQAGV